jgi:uncharacterized membrane protein YdjX (TVP38/TMEM64 family)
VIHGFRTAIVIAVQDPDAHTHRTPPTPALDTDADIGADAVPGNIAVGRTESRSASPESQTTASRPRELADAVPTPVDAPLALAVTVLPPLGLMVLATILSTTNLASWLREGQPGTWFLFVASYWILGLCFLPSLTYSFVAGWCFSFVGGMTASVLGYLGAACGGMHISRRVANDRVMALISRDARALAVHQALLNASMTRSILIVGLLRLAPSFPFAIVNFLLGSAGVSTRAFLIGTVVGMIPRTVAAVWIASHTAKLDLDAAKNWWLLGAGVVATFAVIAVISHIAKQALDRCTQSPARA